MDEQYNNSVKAGLVSFRFRFRFVSHEWVRLLIVIHGGVAKGQEFYRLFGKVPGRIVKGVYLVGCVKQQEHGVDDRAGGLGGGCRLHEDDHGEQRQETERAWEGEHGACGTVGGGLVG